MKNRIISLVLALALLFSLTSCKKETDETPVLDGGLTVETVKVEYSEEAVAGATEDIIALFEKTVDILGYEEHITDDDISEVEGKFKNEIIPALIDLKIYPEELSALIKATDECLELWEENNVENDPKNFSDMYTKLVSIIDTDRLGGLIFELEMTLIGARLEKAEKKYNDHTSSLNLRKLEYYRTLVASAEALGREKFADAMEVILFGVSSLNSKTEFEGGISVSVADTLEIMKKQGERFLSLTLTDEDWQTVARMCEEYLPGKANESLQSKILITLNNDDFFIEAADVMPDVIKLYAARGGEVLTLEPHLQEFTGLSGLENGASVKMLN
ncbi:MAG: hypothetical protein J6Q77_00845, partial [Clostridia bacterium]|nr:hypothetical protein [Clostridia bacterium]